MSHYLTETFSDRNAALRGRRISASRAAGIMGLSKWSSPYKVWCELTGRLPDSEYNPIRFRVGHALEPLIGELYEEHTNREVFPHNQNHIRVHPIYHYITCTPDFDVVDFEKGKGLLQGKSAVASKAEDWEFGCPPDYKAQLNHELLVCGRKWGSLAVIVGNNSFRYIDLDRDDDFINNELLPRYHKFWACVVNDIPPPVDWHPATTEAIEAQYPHENGTTIELPALFEQIDEELTEHKRMKACDEIDIAMRENMIKQYMGEAETAILPGVARYTWRLQKTAGGSLARVFRRTAIK